MDKATFLGNWVSLYNIAESSVVLRELKVVGAVERVKERSGNGKHRI